jgi:cytochrome c biogenesis protein CcmG/thiol:disulfide interchange protein DsbE
VNRWLDRILLGLIAGLGIALVWVVAGTLEPHIVNAGDTAPEFTITTDDGRTVTRDNFGGKLLVLNFWATWCQTCIVEMPTLDQFQREFGKQGVVVLGVSIDSNPKLYRQFLNRARFSFETARDPEADISYKYGTFQIPETYIIDQSGKVVEKFISNQNWMDPDLVARVRRML